MKSRAKARFLGISTHSRHHGRAAADPVGARRRVASDEEDRYTHGRRYGFLNHPDPNSDPCHLPGGKRVPPA